MPAWLASPCLLQDVGLACFSDTASGERVACLQHRSHDYTCCALGQNGPRLHSSSLALATHAAAAPITGLRLANGSDSQGALQVQLAGVAWGSACGTALFQLDSTYSPGSGPRVDNAIADVICRSIGQPGSAGLLLPTGAFGTPGAQLLTVKGCTGNETSLNECSLDFASSCSDGISVVCVNGSIPAPNPARKSAGHCMSAARFACWSICLHGCTCVHTLPFTPLLPADPAITAARLVGGPSPSQGRLEVQYRGAVWGRVCTDGLDLTAAEVACRQAGFSGVGAILPPSTFGPGPAGSPILLGGASCPNSTLASLSDCTLSFYVSGCDHSTDVALACQDSAVGASQPDGTGA